MRKKIPSIPLITLIVLITASMCLAGEPDRFKQAEAYEKQGQYEQAEQIYQQIVTGLPGTDDALTAQKNLAILYIGWDKQSQADIALDQLLTGFSGHDAIAETVWQIAREFGKAENNTRAIELHQYNVEHFPSDKYAMWSQVEMVYSQISQKENDDAIDAAVDTLLDTFADQPTLPKEIYQIAKRCGQLRRFDKAADLNQYNIKYFPHNMYAQLSQIYSNIRNFDYAAADTAVDKLLTEFSDEPDLAEEVYLLTGPYNKARKYQKSVPLYEYFLDKQPEDEQAILAQSGLAIAHMELDNENEAQVAIYKLLTGFSDDERISRVLYGIAQHCYSARKYYKALELHQYNVEHFSRDDKHTMWSQVEIVKSHIRDGNDPAADTSYQKLLTAFSAQPTLATEICRVADTYLNAARTDKARELFECILDNWADSEEVIHARAGLVRLSIAAGEDANARAEIDRLIADFADHPGLAEAVSLIAQGYWGKALFEERQGLDAEANEHYRKALTECERIIQELPEIPDTTAWAHHRAAECYRHFGQHQKTIDYYQKIVDNWPEYPYAVAIPSVISSIKRLLKSHPPPPSIPPKALPSWLAPNAKLKEGGQK